MRVGVVADPTCDLPRMFLDRRGVVIMPCLLRFGETSFCDQRDRSKTLEYFEHLQPKQLQSTQPQAPDTQTILDLFLQRLVIDYDFVFCITNSQFPSGLLSQATRASYAILSRYKRVRQSAGVQGPFALRVVDSGNLYTGQAVVVAELLRQLEMERSVGALRAHLEAFNRHVHTYVLPAEVRQLRGTGTGADRGPGLAGALVANTLNIKPIFCIYQQNMEQVFKAVGYRHGTSTLFEYAAARIEQGLKAPIVCVSFGGNPDTVYRMPGFDALQKAARAREVTLTVSEMSPTTAVSAGARALAVSFAAEHKAFV